MSEEVKEEIEALMSIYEEDMQGMKWRLNMSIRKSRIGMKMKTCQMKILRLTDI